MTVNPIGYSGGLALMWKNSVQIDFKFVDKHLVDCYVKFGKECFLYLVYMVNRLRIIDRSYGKDYRALELIGKNHGVWLVILTK